MGHPVWAGILQTGLGHPFGPLRDDRLYCLQSCIAFRSIIISSSVIFFSGISHQCRDTFAFYSLEFFLGNDAMFHVWPQQRRIRSAWQNKVHLHMHYVSICIISFFLKKKISTSKYIFSSKISTFVVLRGVCIEYFFSLARSLHQILDFL